jgi:hypothetical protein
MKKYKYIVALFLTTALLNNTGCKKDFLDVNENPNSPSTVDVKSVLPSAELAIAHTIGNNFQVFGGIWGQFWTQSPAASQYKTVDQYSPSASDYDRPWRILYADALTDLRYIQSRASAQGLTQYVACAKILEAYSFQLLTDNFGDIPYSEALRADEGILSPHYDSQQSVYNGIIQTALDGVALCDENDPVHPGVDDILFNGDMLEWKRFGNTLLLKMYMRLSEVDPAKAQSGIAALEAANAEFLSEGENALINYTTVGGNTHPYYSVIVDIGGTQNLVASATAVNYMLANNDPRLDVLYAPANNGTQVGIPQGAYTLPASTQVSKPSAYTGADALDGASATASVRFMSDYESLFLQSEAAARGWLTGDAADLYNRAIDASFAATGFTGTESADYEALPAIAFPTAGTTADKVKRIITEKWIAMDGTQGDEAWIEWRRTGYPDFFTPSVNSIAGPGVWPYRLYYPSSEVTRNINFPGQKLINDKVWWDVN